MGSRNAKNPKVFFDITIGGKDAGTITMELFADITPRTAENFRALCTGSSGVGKVFKKPLHLKGTPFHRIVPSYMIQGGDIVNHNGTGGECIWGARFADENFVRKHIGAGIMSMVNKGTNTGASQFMFAGATTKWLDGKNVVFGQVIEGFDVLKAMEAEGSISGRTKNKVIIADCGDYVKKVVIPRDDSKPLPRS